MTVYGQFVNFPTDTETAESISLKNKLKSLTALRDKSKLAQEEWPKDSFGNSHSNFILNKY